MGETTDELKHRIEDQRGQFEGNINELEDRVKHATDWRAQFDERPMTLVAAAFGGGVLLGMLFNGSSDDSDRSNGDSQRPMYQSQSRAQPNGGTMGWITGSQGPDQGAKAGKHRAAEQLDSVRGALLGLGAAKLEEFLSQNVPGFNKELETVESKKTEQRQDSPEAQAQMDTSARQHEQQPVR